MCGGKTSGEREGKLAAKVLIQGPTRTRITMIRLCSGLKGSKSDCRFECLPFAMPACTPTFAAQVQASSSASLSGL